MNRQLALAIQLNDEAALTDFCWDNNQLLQQQVSKSLDGSGERLLTIWGNSGSGKSHLLQGCCQTLSYHKTTIYLPLQILKEWGPESIDGVEEHSLIAIDDIDLIAGHAAWEEALFHLYNKIRDQGETILLISSRQPIHLIKIALADLRSRLSWGLVMQLSELSDELKIKTLQQLARKRGFDLPTTVAQFLISRCARNMHDLQLILNQLDEASLAAQRKITVPFVKAILKI
ncbi:DnaA regulatory inactivator Hda [Legionella brunensis]|uniref:DnaA-like family protein n=1 Tax=Legionella brunensis TaxID=29422 RepID=A0A0W0S0M1_9GAMM|nr:DnaA regulatory inactivator Hda [Legionella brunensis]KTC76886.1 DnaA-like family protein [Legionella brunensis]